MMPGPSRREVSMNRDFVEMLSELSESGAGFLLVGAHALAAHGLPKATGRPQDLRDADWLERPENRIRAATAV
jgi:hypothetical protein